MVSFNADSAAINNTENDTVQNRSERKARKTLNGNGLIRVEGINRVVIRRLKNVLYVVQDPEVFKAPGSDVHIVFGEIKVEDQAAQTSINAAQQIASMSMPESDAAQEAAQKALAAMKIQSQNGKSIDSKAAAESDEPVDEEGVDAKDIELVMSQGNVGRARAVELLRRHDNDIINAIMDASEN